MVGHPIKLTAFKGFPFRADVCIPGNQAACLDLAFPLQSCNIRLQSLLTGQATTAKTLRGAKLLEEVQMLHFYLEKNGELELIKPICRAFKTT